MIEVFVGRIPALVVLWLSLTVHEWAHAAAAASLGDDTARAQGRLSLDPLVHLDPIGTVLLPILGVPLGWARPVPVNPARFSRSVPMTFGMALAAGAGPLSNLVLAGAGVFFVAGLRIFELPADGGPLLEAAWLVIRMNLGLAVFNLLPIPPLDGSRIVNHFLPRSLRGVWELLERAGPFGAFLVLAALRLVGVDLLGGADLAARVAVELLVYLFTP